LGGNKNISRNKKTDSSVREEGVSSRNWNSANFYSLHWICALGAVTIYSLSSSIKSTTCSKPSKWSGVSSATFSSSLGIWRDFFILHNWLFF
jgi:hypothetical protein